VWRWRIVTTGTRSEIPDLRAAREISGRPPQQMSTLPVRSEDAVQVKLKATLDDVQQPQNYHEA